jgi:hypothetical protein
MTTTAPSGTYWYSSRDILSIIEREICRGDNVSETRFRSILSRVVLDVLVELTAGRTGRDVRTDDIGEVYPRSDHGGGYLLTPVVSPPLRPGLSPRRRCRDLAPS